MSRSFSVSQSFNKNRVGPDHGETSLRSNRRRQFKASRCCWSMDMDQLAYETISKIPEEKTVTVAVLSSPAAEPAEPRLVRSGAMRRDWSFEDLKKANPIMVK